MIETDDIYVLLLERCENGNLQELLEQRGKLHEVEVAYIAGQVIDAMRFLHKKFILHRDLRLSNLMLTKDMIVKVIDFDIAKELTSDVGITKS